MHGKSKENSEKVSFISSILTKIKGVAEHFSPIEIWKRVLSMIFIKFLNGRILGEGNWSERWWNEGERLLNSEGPPKMAIEIPV